MKKHWEAAFEDFAQNVFSESRAPGLIVGLNKDGECLYRKSFGYRDAEQRLELTPDTVMGLASVTKSSRSRLGRRSGRRSFWLLNFYPARHAELR
ncbi:serine hydrolase [Brevibacillus sp. SIMBA_040]|uniref:serine hydrolase n=1 Tax=unclassified Brevibacillus TaxID=2684853 RepID=UPI0039792254